MLTGALNDSHRSTAHCHALREQLPADAPVTIRVYPEARTLFDFRGLAPVVKLSKGRTLGYNPEAAAAAWKDVQQFLKR